MSTSIDPGAPWLGITDLTKAVGCSRRQVQGFVRDGLLKPGEHFYSVGIHGGGRKLYSLPRVRQMLLEQAAMASRRRQQQPETYDGEHAEQLAQGGLS